MTFRHGQAKLVKAALGIVFMKRVMVLTLFAVTACGTPQEQCIAAGTRDLKVVEQLITEAEGNIARGYAWQEVTVIEHRWVDCTPKPTAEVPKPVKDQCLVEVPQTNHVPQAINLAEEASTLASLKAKRAEQMAAAKGLVQACKTKYPE